MKNVLAVIPARSGSKGLKNKNIKVIAGKPLISWTIDAALKSKHIDKVIVSTDSKKIEKISKEHGASVPFSRPKDLAEDATSSIDVMLHAVEYFPEYKYIIMLRPTSPLRKYSNIDQAFELFLKSNMDSCVSVTKDKKTPFWSYSITNENSLISLFPNKEIPSTRQEIISTYNLNGAIYISNILNLKEKKSFISEKTFGYEMSDEVSIDIDDINEFRAASRLLKKSLLKK